MYMGKKGVYGGSVKIIVISENYEVSAHVYLHLRAISLSLVVIIGQVQTESNVCLFSAEEENYHYDTLLHAGGDEEIRCFDHFDRLCFHG